MMDYILPTDLERKSAALNRGMEIMESGDFEGAMKVLSTIQLTAGNLAFFKETHGADFIRKYNFDTTRADEEYGQGWLDQ